MAAPTFVAAGAIAGSASSAITPAPPTHIKDDILLISVFNDDGNVPTTSTSGWTEIARLESTDDLLWWWKRATGSGTAGPTIDANGDQFAVCYAYRGCATTGNPFEDPTTVGPSTASARTTAEIDTTGNDRFVISFLGQTSSTALSSFPPATWTADDNQVSTTGTDARLATISKTIASATTVSGVQFATSASARWGILTLALIPPEEAGGTNVQMNIGDEWKAIEGIQINIGDTWKAVEGLQINIGDAWLTIF